MATKKKTAVKKNTATKKILKPDPGSVNPTAKEFNATLAQGAVGLSTAKAERFLRKLGFSMRIRTLDGRGLIGTCDYRLDRANIHLDGDIVTKVTIG